MFSSPFYFPRKTCNKNIKSVFEFSSRKSVAIYFTSGQCGWSLALSWLRVYSPYSQNTLRPYLDRIYFTMSKIARQTDTAEEDSQHIRRKNKTLRHHFLVFPWSVECYRWPRTLLPVIDDKEVASDTWTSSLLIWGLMGHSHLKSLTSSAPQSTWKYRNKTKYFWLWAKYLYSFCLKK